MMPVKNNSIFAVVEKNNLVVNTVVVDVADRDNAQEILSRNIGPARYIECSVETKNNIFWSYHGLPSKYQDYALRANYPLPEKFVYDESMDVFIPIQTDKSLIFNEENFMWEPPGRTDFNVEVYWDGNKWKEVPKPFPSWKIKTYKSLKIWMPPVDHPEDGKDYAWDEKNITWWEI